MRVPKLSRHSSGQYRVRIKKKTVYLGHDKTLAQRKYRQILAQHLGSVSSLPPVTVKVGELLKEYIEYQIERCAPRWRKTRRHLLHQATRHALEMYAALPVGAFGPVAYQEVRRHMACEGRCRSYVNALCSKLKGAFKWGVSREVVRQEEYDRLLSVPDLAPDDLGLPEGREVQQVDVKVVERTLPYLPEHHADIVRLLLWTGARPCEIVRMTPAEINRADPVVWLYEPIHHKTRRKKKKRAVPFGKEAQELLLRYWPKDPQGYFFPGNDEGHLSSAAIYQAVSDACVAADIPHWHPYQLRHSAVTRISLQHGRDVAQAVAGHAKAAMTAHYDHSTLELAKRAVG